ncbi:ATP-binding protein [Streptomyces sp. NRRL F-5727]|uniref:ATP-binding protein n=1 Tax=Streptomyces sp. NRRL F-5727 TaxID=1463871 RepID=UPI0004C98514|nr:ATP-binding protein [Streptomyces sp. NRRL F-5727]
MHEHLCSGGLADLSAGLSADLSADLVLVTSELVTNALVHTDGDVDLRLRVSGGRVRLAVGEHGRGLHLVEALAFTWHTFPTGRGKTVRLETDIPG